MKTLKSVVVLVTVLSTVHLAKADDYDQWGDWAATKNFPGIEIRVKCRYDNPETLPVVSTWAFQLRNSYSRKVWVVYREEAFLSNVNKSAPPSTFSFPSGQAGAVMETQLLGSCRQLPGMRLAVINVYSSMNPRVPLVPLNGAAKRTTDGKAATESGELISHPTNSHQSSGSSASSGSNSTSQSGQEQNPAPRPPTIKPGFYNCHATDSSVDHPGSVRLEPNGTVDHGDGLWTASGTSITWSQTFEHWSEARHTQDETRFEGEITGSTTMMGEVHEVGSTSRHDRRYHAECTWEGD